MGSTLSLDNVSRQTSRLTDVVDSLYGLPGISTSPSDKWHLTFKAGPTRDRYPHGVFLKWWINPTQGGVEGLGQMMPPLVGGLQYEQQVYRTVVQPLLDAAISPNFVAYVASHTGCTTSQLTEIVQKAVDDKTGRRLSRPRALANLTRSVYYLATGALNRPAIQDGKSHTYPISKLMSSTRYDLLLTEVLDPSPVSLHQWMQAENTPGAPLSLDTWRVLFQILCGCYSMGLSRLIHNDNHFNNHLVVTTDEHEVTYVIDGQVYTFSTRYRVLIFDFDRSFATRFEHPNPILDQHCMDNYNQCNEFAPNKDALRLIGHLYNLDYSRVPTDLEKLLKIAAPTGRRDSLSRLFHGSPHLVHIGATSQKVIGRVTPEECLLYRSLSGSRGMIEQLAGMCDCAPHITSNPNAVYVCDQRMFNPVSGTLLTPEVVLEIRKSTLEFTATTHRLMHHLERVTSMQERERALYELFRYLKDSPLRWEDDIVTRRRFTELLDRSLGESGEQSTDTLEGLVAHRLMGAAWNSLYFKNS